jgi:hypothetical protein
MRHPTRIIVAIGLSFAIGLLIIPSPTTLAIGDEVQITQSGFLVFGFVLSRLIGFGRVAIRSYNIFLAVRFLSWRGVCGGQVLEFLLERFEEIERASFVGSFAAFPTSRARRWDHGFQRAFGFLFLFGGGVDCAFHACF